MTTMAAMITRMAAAAGTTKFRFINIANKGLSFSEVSLAGAMVPLFERRGEEEELAFCHDDVLNWHLVAYPSRKSEL